MYRCRNCGEFFDEPIETYDDPSPAGVSLPKGSYVYWSCPCCDSDEIEEASVCARCGEPIKDGDTLCEECKAELLGEINTVADRMSIPREDMEYAISSVYGW